MTSNLRTPAAPKGLMKILIVNMTTHFCLSLDDMWEKDVALARVFKNSMDAVLCMIQDHIHGCQVVLKFDCADFDIYFPPAIPRIPALLQAIR
jgi:hypothetical protein